MSKINLFLDSSALFAGIVSKSGAARLLILLAGTEQITITISEQVIIECERAMARKLPQSLNDFRQSTRLSKAHIVHNPSIEAVKANQSLIAHPADVPIVLAAMYAKVDDLVTLNRRHFLDDPAVAQKAGMMIGTPGTPSSG